MKKKISLVLSLVMMLSSLFTVNVFALDISNVKEGTYIIQSKLGSNMVLDVDDASEKSGANVQLYKKNNTTAQIFEIKKFGSYYTITPKCSGLKLDVQGGSTKSGANVWQYKNNNSDSQKWRFYSAGNGYYYIRCKIGDKALDVAGGKSANGTNIQMYNLNQSNAQKWKLIAVDAEDIVLAELNSLIKEAPYKVGTKYTGPRASEQCKGYARSIHKELFGYDIGSTTSKPNNYKINYSSKNTVYVGSVTGLSSKTKNKVKNLFIKARPGDFVQIRRQHGGPHSAIVVSVSNNSITMVEANLDGKNTISKKTYSWADLCSKNKAMSLYTAKNYKK